MSEHSRQHAAHPQEKRAARRKKAILDARNDDHLLAGRRERPILITGGAGFIGTNLASRLCAQGYQVLVLDNLSRRGVEENLRWLTARYPEHVTFERADVRDGAAVHRAVADAHAVFHLAAQVAVTTSLEDPRYDFDVNVGGTINVLEAARSRTDRPPVIFTSTNKVYGGLGDVSLIEYDSRYEPLDLLVRGRGVSENRALDFHSPYGCSKGAADQYALDYARSYGLCSVVFRMSCIYGPHQFGNEDQGWVAHFVLRALGGDDITLYGDGKQVRDLLFVDDLVEALLIAWGQAERLRGRAFNLGGGPANTTSLLEILELLAALHGSKPPLERGDWRTGDQRYYVSDIRAFRHETGWSPRVNVQEGLGKLYRWLNENRSVTAAAPKRVAP